MANPAASEAPDRRWLLYGANGFTGALIAEEACKRGLSPVLAGRREEAVRPLAERLDLPYRVFDLGAPETLDREFDDVEAVLLAAGPFSATSRPVVEACLRTGTHYLDITGEIPVFEACWVRDEEAKRAGCVLMPGVGFDVVPSDCLAASLARALPSATRLELAFHGVGSPSRGTLKTMVESLGRGGAVRRGGRITPVPTAYRAREIPFRDRARSAMTIPWGDVSTAFHSTGIGHIEVYMALPRRLIRTARWSRAIEPLLRTGLVHRFLERRVDARAPGPDARAREEGRSQLWGRVEDGAGRSVEGTLVTPEGYRLTAATAVESTLRVLGGEIPPGTHTPSSAFGPGYIESFEGCDLLIGETA